MAKVIAIANQKGGSAKTTTTVNLGAALAEQGKRVLLVDFDPQGNLSIYLGIDIEKLEHTIYNVLVEPSTSLSSVVLPTAIPRLSIAPANIDLCAAEIQLVTEMSREFGLQRKLQEVGEAYDYILIDTPPSLGLLVINALTAADEVIMPVQCSFLALRGLGQLLETVEKVRGRLNSRLEVGGILLTMFNGQTSHAQEIVQLTRERFGTMVFNTMVARSIRFDEAPVAGQPILVYAGTSKGSVEYREFAKEVLQHHGHKSAHKRQPIRAKALARA
jgi:chromosome partitioning protein